MKLRRNILLSVGTISGFTPPLIAQSELQPSAKEEGRPNILFILSDDHTSQAWGIYGGVLSDYVKNDNIRRLAAEGCVLDNAFCTNSISVPAGVYPYRGGI